MAPRGDISRPQRWDPDGGPWEGYARGLGTLSISLSLFLPFLISLLKVPKKSSICEASHVCDRGVKVVGMPFSPCLSPSQLVCLPRPTSSLSASSAWLTSWFLFIHFTFGFDAGPLWCGVKYLQGFCFGLYWVGLWWVQTCHLYHIEAFLNRKHSLGGWAAPPLPLFLLWSRSKAVEASHCLKKITLTQRWKLRKEKLERWREIGGVWKQSEERCRRSRCWLTGGVQLANHRGSCDAGVASLLFSQGRKSKVHCLIVPLKRLLNMQTHMHSHSTRDTRLVCSSAVPLRIVQPCLVLVQVNCYDPCQSLHQPSGRTMTLYQDSFILLFFSPGSIWTEFCQLVYLST